MTTALAAAIGVACFLGGLALGAVMNYFVETREVLRRYENLVETLTYMKKQGFVPQFQIEHPREDDPSKDIREY